MTARAASALGLLYVAALTQAPLVAQELSVQIESPPATEAVFGEVDVVVGLTPAEAPVAKVVFYLDGTRAGEVLRPPYRLKVDVGEQNREHEFKVEAFVRGAAAPVAASLTTPAIHIDSEITVELQQLYVTVMAGSERALDLDAGDFRISDDGEGQRLVTFARGDIPLTAVLLLDSSESMKGARLAAALAGARAFVDSMKDLDQASALLFAGGLMRATPFTDETAVITAAFDGLEAKGNTAVNDYVYLALAHLDQRQGRRVVILLSDGADLHSVLDMSDVVWKARRSQAMVYWIRLEDSGDEDAFLTAWRNAEQNAAQLQFLEQLVAEGGGRIAGVASQDGIVPAFREILAELREQYVLGYYPSTNLDDGRWHEVGVAVKGFGRSVRARKGYVDY